MTNRDDLILCPNLPRIDVEGNWIWVAENTGYEWHNSYAYFRRKFYAAGKLVINIAADTRYEFFVDGKRINRGTAPADVAYKIFDTHFLTVEPGEHVIAVLVHHIGQACATVMKSRPGLFVEITMLSGLKITTDRSWKVMPAAAFEQHLPCMMSHFGFYEVCDCKKIPQGWTELSFDDNNWLDAEIIGKVGCEPWLRMIPRDIPLLATTEITTNIVVAFGTYEIETFNESEKNVTVAIEMARRKRKKYTTQSNLPIRMAKGKENEFIAIDFGREVTGHLKLGFRGAKDGQQVDIGYDETLDDKGLPNPRRTYVHFADRFYLNQDQQVVEVFDARGFRYLLIDIPAGKDGLVLTRVQIEERTYPIANEGSFSCSSKELEEIYQAGINTLKLCMLDTYVDCSSRERVMWMDSYIAGVCSVYGVGDTALWKKALYIFAQNVSRNNGILSGAVKGYAPTDGDPLLLSYVIYYVCSVSDYCWHTGDRETCIALFDTVMKQLEILEHFTNSDGLINDKWPSKWGTFIDWSAMDNGGISAGNNAIYIKMLHKLARMANTLEKYTLAENLLQKAQAATYAFQKSFWVEQEGLFADAVYDGKLSPVRSQLVNIMAIWAGVVNKQVARSIVHKITNDDALLPRTKGDYRLKSDFVCQTGGIVQIGTPANGTLMAHVMFMLGMEQQAIAYIKQNWLPIIKNGTISEHFELDDNTSFCHAWGAGPVLLLPRFILGVKPLSPGWKTIEIVPHTSNLSWAKGTIPTALGNITVSWERVGGTIDLSIEVPDGITVIKPQQTGKLSMALSIAEFPARKIKPATRKSALADNTIISK